jgi:hypothetical protein
MSFTLVSAFDTGLSQHRCKGQQFIAGNAIALELYVAAFHDFHNFSSLRLVWGEGCGRNQLGFPSGPSFGYPSR